MAILTAVESRAGIVAWGRSNRSDLTREPALCAAHVAYHVAQTSRECTGVVGTKKEFCATGATKTDKAFRGRESK